MQTKGNCSPHLALHHSCAAYDEAPLGMRRAITLNPKPLNHQTLNCKPITLNPKPLVLITLNPQPPNPKPYRWRQQTSAEQLRGPLLMPGAAKQRAIPATSWAGHLGVSEKKGYLVLGSL